MSPEVAESAKEPTIVNISNNQSANSSTNSSASSGNEANEYSYEKHLENIAKSGVALLSDASLAPKVLWASPFALHDISSGKAHQARVMLQALQASGLQVQAICGLIFDCEEGKAAFTDLEEKLKDDKKFFQAKDNGIDYTYTRTASIDYDKFTQDEQNLFFARYCEILRCFRPDIVISSGDDLMSLTVRAEAKRRGIPSIYCVFDPYCKKYSFEDVDLVLTDSKALASILRSNDIKAEAIGEFIDVNGIKAGSREPKYVTLINATPAKGLAIFAKLALMAQKALPEVKFLCMSSKERFAAYVNYLHEQGKPAGEIKPEMFPNIDLAQPLPKIANVYALSKVIFAPSIAFESMGRSVLEGLINGIPALVSLSGGLRESVNGSGGFCVEVPLSCQQDMLCLPSDEEMQPWLEALKALLNEDWTERCNQAIAKYNLKDNIKNLLEILRPFIQMRASFNPQILRTGITTR